jgi:hypothetical protein
MIKQNVVSVLLQSSHILDNIRKNTSAYAFKPRPVASQGNEKDCPFLA